VFGGDVVGPVVSAGGDPFWSERLECDPLPDDGTGAGRREAEGGCGATGARCAWTVVRAAIRALVDDPGHHARRAQDGAGRATRLASSGALWRFFHRHKITRKKDRAWHEQDRPDIVKRREPGSMASGISIPTAMCSTPQRPTSTTPAAGMDGRRNGQRLRVGVPYVHSKTTIFVAGLHLNEIVAPVVLDGSTNGSAFERPSADTDLSISSRRNLFGVLGRRFRS
jgi:hypothetical protein